MAKFVNITKICFSRKNNDVSKSQKIFHVICFRTHCCYQSKLITWVFSKPYSGWGFLGLLTDEGTKAPPPHGWGGGRQKTPLLKICHTYPTMIKLLGTVISYLKKIQKNIWITWHTLWVLLTSAFFTKNQQILLYQKMQILYFDT